MVLALAMVSENALPIELKDVNTSTTKVMMEYEQDRKIVHVYLKTSGGKRYPLELRIADGGLCGQVRLQNDHSPVAVLQA